MRKSTLVFVALSATMAAFGQVEVKLDGKVEITPSGGQGVYVNVAPSGSIKGPFYGLYGYSSGSPLQINLLTNGYTAGVMGTGILTGSGSSSSAVSFGVIGQGTGSTLGRNIGVFGYFLPEIQILGAPPVYGAGIFGATQFGQSARNFTQAYAGFFAGDVEITTQLKVNTTLYSSDSRYKQNIADLRQQEVNKVYRLNPVVYNLRQRYTEYIDSTGNPVQVGVFDEKSQLFQKNHYGLIAQEVRELYPDLVYEDGDGYLSVDYIGVIPLLINAVKELKAQVDELKRNDIPVISDPARQQSPAAPGIGEEMPNIKDLAVTQSALYQNAPNPFTHATEIKYYLPENYSAALLCIYDLQGRELKQITLNGHGAGSHTLHGHELHAGIYIYSLIVNGNVVDTKRMTLTK